MFRKKVPNSLKLHDWKTQVFFMLSRLVLSGMRVLFLRSILYFTVGLTMAFAGTVMPAIKQVRRDIAPPYRSDIKRDFYWRNPNLPTTKSARYILDEHFGSQYNRHVPTHRE